MLQWIALTFIFHDSLIFHKGDSQVKKHADLLLLFFFFLAGYAGTRL